MAIQFKDLGRRVREKLATDRQTAAEKEALNAKEAERIAKLHPFDRMKEQYPNQQIYALLVRLRCPGCGFHKTVARFVTKSLGNAMHVFCPTKKCGRILTMRDVVLKYGPNTFPVDQCKAGIEAKLLQFFGWLQRLERGRVFIKLAQAMYRKMNGRRDIITPDEQSGRIRMRTSIETPEEAAFYLGKNDPMVTGKF